ncbi:MAG TPA: MFS transporter, partial [Candidatus Brocadiia bacterium]|nr:MFS transporter [Candidatus Brocadiia bacterium]
MDEGVTRLFRRASVGPRRAVRRYFGYRVVYAWQLPAIMRKHIYTGAMGNIYSRLLSGVFFVYFGNRVGLTPFDWGLMGGLTSFLIVAQVFSALLTEVSGRRKLVWFATAFSERALRLAGILAAFWLWSSGRGGAAFALIASVCAANLLGAMASPPWLSWLADIIPAKSHGQFWGRRAAWVSLSVIVVMTPIGFLMDQADDTGKMTIALWTFVAGGLTGLLDIVIHGTIPEPRVRSIGGGDAFRRLFAPLRDRGFRPWLVFNFCWTASMSLGGSLSLVFLIEDLKIKQNMLAGAMCVTGCSLLGGMVTSRWSGRMVDRLGVRRMLRWGHLG